MSRSVSIFASALVAGTVFAGTVKAADLLPAPAEPVTVEAQQVQMGNLYAWIGGGVAILNDLDISTAGVAAGVPFTATGTLNYQAGPAFAAGLGYMFNDFVGIEAQLTYARLGFDSLDFAVTAAGATATGTASIDGHTSLWTGLGNVIVTPFGRNRITPYVGGGLGVVHAHTEVDSIAAGGAVLRPSVSDRSTDLAASAIAGLDVSVTDRVDIGARYQFFYADTGGNGVDDSMGHALFLRAKVAF